MFFFSAAYHLLPNKNSVAWLFVWALMLQGCQTLPVFQDNELSVTTGKAEIVETHDFGLEHDQNLVGTLVSIDSRAGDTLSDLARHFGLGFTDITIANPHLDPWVLQDNQDVLLPLQFVLPDAPRKGIVLNLANMRMFYYSNNAGKVQTYPVGIGRDGWNTPLGVTKIVAKKAKPSWTVPESIHREHQQLGEPLPKVIPAGPDNPLGEYAMPLGFTGYLIHGTNKPYGIGMQVSHGCVQLYPEDIEALFDRVEVGTSVRIVHQPYLTAWEAGVLYLEAHKPLGKWAKQEKKLRVAAHKSIEVLAADKGVEVDWQKVDAILERADGIPTPILLGSPDLAELRSEAIRVAHPTQLYGQPTVAELTERDWSILMPNITDATEAEKLAAMLNHLGPQIPARKIEKDGVYQVVAGPFKDKKETRAVARKIKNSFDLEVKTVKPSKSSK